MNKLVFTFLFFALVFLFTSCNDDNDCSCTGDIYGKWEVEEFMSIESVAYPKDDGYSPTIEFKNDGTIDISLDINSCFGDFELGTESSINISNAGCTEACCDSDFSMKFIEMLPQVGSYEIEDDELRLNISGWGWINLVNY